jgi:hypothetical protein
VELRGPWSGSEVTRIASVVHPVSATTEDQDGETRQSIRYRRYESEVDDAGCVVEVAECMVRGNLG